MQPVTVTIQIIAPMTGGKKNFFDFESEKSKVSVTIYMFVDFLAV